MPVLGIDLGASSTVLATVGKGGVAIVRNDLADRLTPTLVSYTSKERLIGDSALTSLKANLKVTAQNFKYLLGAPANWEQQAGWKNILEYEQQYALAPFDCVSAAESSSPQQSTARTSPLLGFRVSEDEVVTAVEVLAVFLKKMAQMGANFLGFEARDVVVAVPSWFPETSRRAVLDACVIANLNCLGVMNHSTATALDYGLFRKSSFEANKVYSVAFVDMGYSSCTCSLVDYSQGALEIRCVREDNRLGGRTLDSILLNRMADAFFAKTKCDVRSNMKAKRKLLEAVEKAKKVLSANRETNVHLECLMEDEDLNETVTRENFEEMCSEFRAHLRNFLASTLAESKLNPAELVSIEICGGCTRIPFVQEDIKAVFANRDLSRTISGDECVARGAAIFAAMRSPAHRVAQFEVRDRLPRTLSVWVESPAHAPLNVDKQQVTLDPRYPQELDVFAAGTVVPRVSVWTCPAVFIEHGRMRLRIEPSSRCPNPFPFSDHFELEFNDEQVQRARAVAANTPGQSLELKIFFEINHNLLPTVYAEVLGKTEEPVINKKQVPKLNEEGVAIEGEFDTITEPGINVKSYRSDVKVTVSHYGAFMTSSQVQLLTEKEVKLAERDESAEKARRLANDILSNCFDYRDKLQGSMKDFASDAEKQSIQELTYTLAEWVENNPDLSVTEYEEQWRSLETAFGGVKSRYDECVRCDSRQENLEKQYRSIRKKVDTEMSKKFGNPARCQGLVQQMEENMRQVKDLLQAERMKAPHTMSPSGLRQCSSTMEDFVSAWVKEYTSIAKESEKAEKAEKARLEAEAAKMKAEKDQQSVNPDVPIDGSQQTQAASDVPMDA